MLKILVCFKVVDDTDELLKADWQDLGTGSPDTSYVKRILGCFDEAALENALRLKDAATAEGGAAHITAVSINPGYSRHILENLPAVKIDRVASILCQGDLRFAAETVAELLAAFAKESGPYDLIMTGSMSPPASSGMVPLLLAEELGLPCLTEVHELAPLPQGIRVGHAVNGGQCFRTVTGRFVCAVGNARYSYLRVPTLRDKLRAKSFPFEILEMDARASGGGLLELAHNADERKCRFAQGGNAAEKAASIYRKYLRGDLS